tara:strand:+ start:2401 stop:2601 length:201 start_codon:yes stop_codon:yes gene_type:complete
MSQLKTTEEMHEMSIKELKTYEHELYLVWQQARVIVTYRKEMEQEQILLNSTDVVDVKMIGDGEEE